ncbi:hypothetical protein NPS01_42690 [Nocardioides psychrotolerans]|uniref:Phage prohead protease, HK97 family n=2 Tax=Nocardioides psychrotolerans TaxID=1005945 RepID=A0A1I3MBA1_9ACTN|nr:hypothetical protein NPS01_42690 [Nocardioides psychrotolerans]SFI94207.1 phage prohead protease, HK97 family [Nocardioides psychrotolerans]
MLVAALDASQDGAETFAVDAASVPAEVFGLGGYSASVAPAARVQRREAIQVPAVKRSRDLVCGTLGGLPLDLFDGNRQPVAQSPFAQPERNVPRSVTMTRLFEDMFFEEIAWWQVTERYWAPAGQLGYPMYFKRLAPGRVQVDDERDRVYVDGKEASQRDLIRFDSPTDGLLKAGARAIRTCLALDVAAANASDGVPAVQYFMPTEGADPAEDDEIQELLDAAQEARRRRSIGYVPASLKLVDGTWDPAKLQLVEQRQHAVLEIARVSGVDPEELGVSTTSRTYSNQFDRRKAFTDFTLGLYRQAVEDRLSMGDVTPRGQYAKFSLDAFLRSDPLSRYQAYAAGREVGALDDNDIARLEDRPAPATPISTNTEESNVITLPGVAASATGPIVTFGDAPAIRLDAPQNTEAFEVDVEKRTIKGLAVPYGVPGRSNGKTFQFAKGTLKYADVRRVKLWVQHDSKQAVGVATKLDDRDDGLHAEFSVARGEDGDRILALAEDGVLDGLSIGLGQGGQFRLKDGVHFAQPGVPLMEISLTPAPSFDDARVHAVAASAAGDGGDGAEAFEAATATLGKVLLQAFGSLGTNPLNPQGSGPEQISATQGLAVNEPSPYRFDGVKAEHSFTGDLRDAQQGDPEARQRIEEFTDELASFAVTTTNTASLNPTKNRPDLYVPNLQFSRPLWELVSSGVVEDVTPFTVPKFASAAGLVGAHTQGVEPTPGSFSATVQTITPAPKSGKIEINREVWDQGGSPQADAIIWGEMLNGWYESLETMIATTLAAIGTAELNLAGAVDAPLVDALTGYFAGLQFVRGGNRFTQFAADGNLFPALVSAKDGDGRPLLPILGPTNAQGSTDGSFDRVAVGNQNVRAAWALGTGNDKKSYNFVKSSVWAWASTPKKFTFEYQVKSIDMAIWGYGASAVLRDSDVKPVDYTTSDTP